MINNIGIVERELTCGRDAINSEPIHGDIEDPDDVWVPKCEKPISEGAEETVHKVWNRIPYQMPIIHMPSYLHLCSLPKAWMDLLNTNDQSEYSVF